MWNSVVKIKITITNNTRQERPIDGFKFENTLVSLHVRRKHCYSVHTTASRHAYIFISSLHTVVNATYKILILFIFQPEYAHGILPTTILTAYPPCKFFPDKRACARHVNALEYKHNKWFMADSWGTPNRNASRNSAELLFLSTLVSTLYFDLTKTVSHAIAQTPMWRRDTDVERCEGW